MAKIELTVQQIINLGLWEDVCNYKEWNPYIAKEGRIDLDELVEFDDEFKKEEKLGDEITFHEAYDRIIKGETVKFIYIDSSIDYMDKYDGLDDLKFKDFAEAKFYVNYED